MRFIEIEQVRSPIRREGSRRKSRQQMFEHNGCRGKDIFRHPRFLDYLRMFLYGANLPEPVIVQFRQAVNDCGQVSSSDIAPLGKKARAACRAMRM
jgi:hypothetical protein